MTYILELIERVFKIALINKLRAQIKNVEQLQKTHKTNNKTHTKKPRKSYISRETKI